jgi:hypothetical protein
MGAEENIVQAANYVERAIGRLVAYADRTAEDREFIRTDKYLDDGERARRIDQLEKAGTASVEKEIASARASLDGAFGNVGTAISARVASISRDTATMGTARRILDRSGGDVGRAVEAARRSGSGVLIDAVLAEVQNDPTLGDEQRSRATAGIVDVLAAGGDGFAVAGKKLPALDQSLKDAGMLAQAAVIGDGPTASAARLRMAYAGGS